MKNNLLIVSLYLLLIAVIPEYCFAQWVQMSNGMGTSRYIYSMAVIGNNIFAGTDQYGVFLSTDNGESWTNAGLDGQDVMSFGVIENRIFASTYNYYYPYGNVHVSTNYGINWTQTSLMYKNVSSLASLGNNLLAGTYNSTSPSGVYRSTDYGNTWIQSGLSNVITLSVIGNNIFAGTYFFNTPSGIALSTDNGISWSPAGLNDKVVNAFAAIGNIIFVGTYQHGVYCSSNNGISWSQTSFNTKSVSSLESNGNNVFASTDNSPLGSGGVYLSTNNGISWTQKKQGFMQVPNITKLLIVNDYIFAATENYSIWRASLSDIIGIQNISTEIPNIFSISQNFPNPFNPATNIKFDIPKSSDVKIMVYDISGKELEVLVNQKLQAGIYQTEWNGANYSSGVYFYKIQTDGFSDTKRMLLIK